MLSEWMGLLSDFLRILGLLGWFCYGDNGRFLLWIESVEIICHGGYCNLPRALRHPELLLVTCQWLIVVCFRRRGRKRGVLRRIKKNYEGITKNARRKYEAKSKKIKRKYEG